jgi:translocation and assembly module TamA
VVADPANASGLSVPVAINTTEAKKRLYSGGVGYATDIGPRLRLNYRNRRVNRRGHTLEGQLQLSTAQSLIGTEYRIPFGDDRRDTLSLRFGITQEDIATSNTDAYEFELRQTRAMDNGWLRSLFVDARREFFRIADQDSSSTLVIPGINWWRITEKADPRPRSGYRMSIELRGTSTVLASDTSFVQAQAQAKHIRSFGERTRLLSRLSLGATWRDELRELPPSVRFFVGGDGSVRGYQYQSLGPRDENGVVVGGSNLLTGSLELDYRLSNAWAVAAFVDSGSAFNATDVDFSTGAGVGLRWLTAIGPVRIDLATPFDLDRKLRLHLSIGADL